MFNHLVSSLIWSGIGIALNCSSWPAPCFFSSAGLTIARANSCSFLLSSSLTVISKGSGTVGANFLDWGALRTLTLGLLLSPSSQSALVFKLSLLPFLSSFSFDSALSFLRPSWFFLSWFFSWNSRFQSSFSFSSWLRSLANTFNSSSLHWPLLILNDDYM